MDYYEQEIAVKDAIKQLLVAARDIGYDEAEDIIEVTQGVVNDVLAGESVYYNSPDEVIEDYLGLTAEYTVFFIRSCY